MSSKLEDLKRSLEHDAEMREQRAEDRCQERLKAQQDRFERQEQEARNQAEERCTRLLREERERIQKSFDD